jgi:hypothetical protein
MMTQPTDSDRASLARVVMRTGHRRFLDLLNPDHPDYNPAYWPAVWALDANAGAVVRPNTSLGAGPQQPDDRLAGG